MMWDMGVMVQLTFALHFPDWDMLQVMLSAQVD